MVTGFIEERALGMRLKGCIGAKDSHRNLITGTECNGLHTFELSGVNFTKILSHLGKL